MKFSIQCGCTDDSLCDLAKKLWRMTSSKGRQKYNNHRQLALNSDSCVDSYWANNITPDGEKIPLKTLLS